MAEREEALREAQLLSALRHPNIIAYKESFIEDADKTLVIVTAYAEEGDLFTHIKRARESGGERARAGVDILGAVVMSSSDATPGTRTEPLYTAVPNSRVTMPASCSHDPSVHASPNWPEVKE